MSCWASLEKLDGLRRNSHRLPRRAISNYITHESRMDLVPTPMSSVPIDYNELNRTWAETPKPPRCRQCYVQTRQSYFTAEYQSHLVSPGIMLFRLHWSRVRKILRLCGVLTKPIFQETARPHKDTSESWRKNTKSVLRNNEVRGKRAHRVWYCDRLHTGGIHLIIGVEMSRDPLPASRQPQSGKSELQTSTQVPY